MFFETYWIDLIEQDEQEEEFTKKYWQKIYKMFNIHHSSDKCFLITTHCTSSADISWVREKDVFFQWVGESGQWVGVGGEDRMGKKELLFFVKMLTLKWIKYCWGK